MYPLGAASFHRDRTFLLLSEVMQSKVNPGGAH